MGRIPDKPEDIFDAFAADYRKAFGDDLAAIILFGSAARGEYVRHRSDINMLVVLSEQGITQLEVLSALTARWHKRRVATPLFMTAEDIDASLDTFPIEFLNIRRHYRMIFGRDVLADLEFKPEHLRLQCERELKAKALLLLERFVELDGHTGKTRSLISESITAFFSIFRALLYLKRIEIPAENAALIQAVAEQYGIDAEIFKICADIREGKIKPAKEGIARIFNRYLLEARKLSARVDQTAVTSNE